MPNLARLASMTGLLNPSMRRLPIRIKGTPLPLVAKILPLPCLLYLYLSLQRQCQMPSESRASSHNMDIVSRRKRRRVLWDLESRRDNHPRYSQASSKQAS